MKDLCTCIAAIGALEVPTQHWAEFVSVMSDQARQNEHMYFKRAAIYILGLLVESLPLDALSDDDLGKIWHCMLENANSGQSD